MQDRIEENINSLLRWLELNDYSSFDHYDYWSTKFGRLGKRLFSKNKFLGSFFVAPIYFLDTFWPASRRFFTKQSRSAEAIPRIATGYFRLYGITQNPEYLEKGLDLLNWLKANVSQSEHGIGWGLHFDWQAKEFVPKNTPCVTLTAYSTLAFLEGYRLTGNGDFFKIAQKTGEFVLHDLNQRKTPHQLSLSYTPLDHNFVINANSYAARILLEISAIDSDRQKVKRMDKIVNYIIDQQNADGSWYYSDKKDVPPKNNFIDSFHTCFVLENLFSIWKSNKDERLMGSISRGHQFFVDNFITRDFSVRYHYCYPCSTGILVDIRGCAEAICSLAVLSEIFPQGLDLAVKVFEWTVNNMRDEAGFYYFRIYKTHKHKSAYIRWAQAPMFNALTCLLSVLRS
jgi:hypothetical protein